MIMFGINMNNKNIENFSILAQYANELAKDSGVPGIGLVGHFSQAFYNKYLASRFEKFAKDAEVDERMINDILENENYSNYFYSALETVRRTHSKLGLIALALLYKDYWDNADILISAMRAFAEISDKQILSFVELYESIPKGEDEVNLYRKDGGEFYRRVYADFVDLVGRGFFGQFTSSRLGSGLPIEGRKWAQSDLYYKYCKKAIVKMNAEVSLQI